jgi:hypothetical protein
MQLAACRRAGGEATGTRRREVSAYGGEAKTRGARGRMGEGVKGETTGGQHTGSSHCDGGSGSGSRRGRGEHDGAQSDRSRGHVVSVEAAGAKCFARALSRHRVSACALCVCASEWSAGAVGEAIEPSLCWASAVGLSVPLLRGTPPAPPERFLGQPTVEIDWQQAWSAAQLTTEHTERRAEPCCAVTPSGQAHRGRYRTGRSSTRQASASAVQRRQEGCATRHWRFFLDGLDEFPRTERNCAAPVRKRHSPTIAHGHLRTHCVFFQFHDSCVPTRVQLFPLLCLLRP